MDGSSISPMLPVSSVSSMSSVSPSVKNPTDYSAFHSILTNRQNTIQPKKGITLMPSPAPTQTPPSPQTNPIQTPPSPQTNPIQTPPSPQINPSKQSTKFDLFTTFTQHLYDSVPFLKGQQPLHLVHCVQKVFVSSCYGEFSIYDKSGRLLGKSQKHELSFLKKDLTTECARVWYDAYSIQGEGDVLRTTHRVPDPGLFFGFGDVSIEFEDAPEIDCNYVFLHIPIFFNVTNVWDSSKKMVVYYNK